MQTGEDLKFPNPVRSTGRFYRALKRIELDLSSITWAVLHLKIERPGRYEISVRRELVGPIQRFICCDPG